MHGSRNSWNLIQEIEEAESINKFKEKKSNFENEKSTHAKFANFTTPNYDFLNRYVVYIRWR